MDATTSVSFHNLCDPPAARLRIAGELDLATGERLLTALAGLVSQGCRLIELDLDGVVFIDAYTLGLLDRERRRLRGDGGDLTVATASARCQRVVRLAGYDELRPQINRTVTTGSFGSGDGTESR